MKAETKTVAGRKCRMLLYPDRPVVFRGIPENDWDDGRIRKQEEAMRDLQTGVFFFSVGEWNDAFSPWPAKTRAGGFGGGAPETLKWLEQNAVPYVRGFTDFPLILAGYSLAGLFSLWCMSNTDVFSAYVSCSGSLWYPGWEEYSRSAAAGTECSVYLSLGDREARTKNPDLCRVEDATLAQSLLLVKDRNVRASVLVPEPGGHFNEPENRMLRGIRWALAHLSFSGPEDRNAADGNGFPKPGKGPDR